MIAEAAGDAFFELDVATQKLTWRSYGGLEHIAEAEENGLQIGVVEGLKTALDRVIYCSELVAQLQAYGRKSLQALQDQGHEERSYVRVEIEDSGVGISENNIESVLDPFFTTRGRASASRMGLPMVHGMIAQHGGFLDIYTTVYFYFPVSLQDIQVNVKSEPIQI